MKYYNFGADVKLTALTKSEDGPATEPATERQLLLLNFHTIEPIYDYDLSGVFCCTENKKDSFEILVDKQSIQKMIDWLQRASETIA